MKKIILVTVAALSLSATTGLSASANSASGFNVSQHSGVTVYRGAPQHVNHQVVAAHRALDLQERQIDNQARQAAAQQSCLLYTSPSPRDGLLSRMPSSA